jgi:8-oxo-dGTP pyrophosphatase MutT (NUDIX family)
MNNENFCNNCGKPGHIFIQCKIPITSYGIIAFRYNQEREPEFLMIRRKDTLGFIDFLRGKYLVQNKYYIMNMLKQMTQQEKESLKKGDFNELWRTLWGDNVISNKYKAEENTSRDKYNMLYYGILNKNDYFTLNMLIDESNQESQWNEPEWGFPKGRRNYQEKDYDCAVREFIEETGYSFKKNTSSKLHSKQGGAMDSINKNIKNIQNILPYEEIFIGSNYKSYKHKYYLMYFDYEESMTIHNFEKAEVSKMEWKSYPDCMNCIRPYNLEKKRVITNIYQCLKKYRIFYS